MGTKVTMTLHEALGRLKTLKKEVAMLTKIETVATFTPQMSQADREQIKAKLVSNFQSANALKSNYIRIQKALTKANAETLVPGFTVDGVEMTILDTVQYKNSLMAFVKSFRDNLYTSLTRERERVSSRNETLLLSEAFERYLASSLGEKGTRNADDVSKLTELYKKTHSYELCDPNNLSLEIEKIENELKETLTVINFKLSEINCSTRIEIELL